MGVLGKLKYLLKCNHDGHGSGKWDEIPNGIISWNEICNVRSNWNDMCEGSSNWSESHNERDSSMMELVTKIKI